MGSPATSEHRLGHDALGTLAAKGTWSPSNIINCTQLPAWQFTIMI